LVFTAWTSAARGREEPRPTPSIFIDGIHKGVGKKFFRGGGATKKKMEKQKKSKNSKKDPEKFSADALNLQLLCLTFSIKNG